MWFLGRPPKGVKEERSWTLLGTHLWSRIFERGLARIIKKCLTLRNSFFWTITSVDLLFIYSKVLISWEGGGGGVSPCVSWPGEKNLPFGTLADFSFLFSVTRGRHDGKRRWLVCIYHWLWKNNYQMCGLLIVGEKLPTNNRNVVFILCMFLFNSELLLSDKLMKPHKSFGKWIYKNLSVVNIAKCYMLYVR